VQTWIVGTNPASYMNHIHKEPITANRERFLTTRVFSLFKMTTEITLQEFIMKAHIFAGAVRAKKKYCSDFIWVTRHEMEKMIDSKTLKAIRPLLAER
jgi:hypothetical protein